MSSLAIRPFRDATNIAEMERLVACAGDDAGRPAIMDQNVAPHIAAKNFLDMAARPDSGYEAVCWKGSKSPDKPVAALHTTFDGSVRRTSVVFSYGYLVSPTLRSEIENLAAHRNGLQLVA